MRHQTAIMLITSILWATTAFGGPPILVGVLEQPQCKRDVQRAVRVLFEKRAGGWAALKSAESSLNLDLSRIVWTIAFDGQRIGSLRTEDPGFANPYAPDYARDRLLNISPGQSLPRAAGDAKRFEGWCGPPKHPPRVVVSKPNFRDPARWKRFNPDSAHKKILFDLFAVVAGPALVCPRDPESPTPFEYGVKDLLIHRGYEDGRGTKLIALRLRPETNNCDGPPQPAWWSQWFLLRKENPVFLGAQLELVDTGDYDSDGASELIFWHSGYNEDGYTLFYDNFKKRVDYYWTYH